MNDAHSKGQSSLINHIPSEEVVTNLREPFQVDASVIGSQQEHTASSDVKETKEQDDCQGLGNLPAKPNKQVPQVATHPMHEKSNNNLTLETNTSNWKCQTCTLLNEDGAPRCTVCETPRTGSSINLAVGAVKYKSPTSLPKPSANSWSCPRCTLQNPIGERRCVVCGQRGQRLSTSTDKGWICCRCTHANNANDSRCSECNAEGSTPNKTSSDGKDLWTCRVCTLKNNTSVADCVVCGGSKEQSRSKHIQKLRRRESINIDAQRNNDEKHAKKLWENMVSFCAKVNGVCVCVDRACQRAAGGPGGTRPGPFSPGNRGHRCRGVADRMAPGQPPEGRVMRPPAGRRPERHWEGLGAMRWRSDRWAPWPTVPWQPERLPWVTGPA